MSEVVELLKEIKKKVEEIDEKIRKFHAPRDILKEAWK